MKLFKSKSVIIAICWIIFAANASIFLLYVTRKPETKEQQLQRLESVQIECNQMFTNPTQDIKDACGNAQAIAHSEYICSSHATSSSDCWTEDKTNG